MTLFQAGALVSRGIGTFLFINGVSVLGRLFLYSNIGSTPGTAGWTSYSPGSSSFAFTQQSFQQLMILFLPPLLNLVMAFLLIYFSRVAGHWLAKGLAENDYE